MNRTEHLLVCLAEECAEVQQAVSKALRFGLGDGYPGAGSTNAQDIARELMDLHAVMDMLVSAELIVFPPDMFKKMYAKRVRVRKYMDYAEERGTLEGGA